MRRSAALLVLILVATLAAPPAARSAQLDRETVIASLGTTLAAAGPTVGITDFHRSTKNPNNYIGTLDTGLKNAEALEIVVGVTKENTIGFRIYPHVRGGYMNITKAKKAAALRKLLLDLNDSNFMFWGADDTDDVFVGYTFTLESGYPEDALRTVVGSIPLQDAYIAKMIPLL